MRTLVLTDEKGIAVLRAAGLPCEEIGISGMAAAGAPVSVQQADTTGRLPTTRRVTGGRSMHTRDGRKVRWGHFVYVRLGEKKPAPGVNSLKAWSWHRCRELFESSASVMLEKKKLREHLISAYEKQFSKPCTSSSSIMTGLLDNKWLEPVME